MDCRKCQLNSNCPGFVACPYMGDPATKIQVINARMAKRRSQLAANALQIAWYTAAKYHVGEILVIGAVLIWFLR